MPKRAGGSGLIRSKNEVFDDMWVRYEYELTEKGWKEVEDLENECLERIVKKYNRMELRELLRYVYRNYPDESTPTIEDISRGIT